MIKIINRLEFHSLSLSLVFLCVTSGHQSAPNQPPCCRDMAGSFARAMLSALEGKYQTPPAQLVLWRCEVFHRVPRLAKAIGRLPKPLVVVAVPQCAVGPNQRDLTRSGVPSQRRQGLWLGLWWLFASPGTWHGDGGRCPDKFAGGSWERAE